MTARCTLYACPDNFWESLSWPTATFPESFNELLFRSILLMYVRTKFELNLKFVALPIPEIIGVTLKKLWQSLYTPTSLFSKIFNGLLFGWTCECTGQIWSPYSFTHSWDNSDWIFGWGLRTPNLGEEEAKWGSGMVPFERALVSSYALHSNFSSIFTSFGDTTFVLQHATFSHPSLPQISPCSPGIRWIAFGLRRTKVLG